MAQEPWDLVVAAFCETHPAGHYLWPAEAAAGTDPKDARFRPLRQIYAAIDRAIGEVRAMLPPDAILIVASGDGVRPNRCGWHLLPAVLERLGYTNAPTDGHQAAAQPGRRSALATIKDLVPERGRRWVADSLPWWLRDRIGARLQASQIDWSRTRAFALPTDLEGCIRVNLRGREPAGIVDPGGEYDDLCREIRQRLSELVNPASGEPAVREVSLCSEIFPGERRDQLPDVVVAWNDAAPIAALQAPGLGPIEGASPDPRTGTHSTSGFLLAHGPAIPQGAGGTGHLAQVAPSVLRLLGLDPDLQMEGNAFDTLALARPARDVRAAQGAE
jgi:predicted AlkP superfamily phosphohydrolase/phosphomutase